jgi:hypothetical protein
MSEEEKQAIETVKQYKKCFIFETVHEETGERINDYSNAIDIVTNLIDKQRKKIKKLNSKINTDNIINKERAELIEQQRKEIENLINEKNIYKELTKMAQQDTRIWKDMYYKNKTDTISKDKIREIIYGNYEDLEIILLIKELLEE